MEIRKLWLVNPKTDAVWDLLPNNPVINTVAGCPLVEPTGFGYSQNVSQKQVEVDFFVDKITSTVKNTTGKLFFKNSAHISAFRSFVGDFTAQLRLCYSPDGSATPTSGTPFYKPVTLSSVEKAETNGYGWYECKTEFVPQSAVWRRDVEYIIENTAQEIGGALVYPWVYPYVFGGQNVLALEITNTGRETGCVVNIKNLSSSPVSDVEFVLESSYINARGETIREYQRAKFYAALQQNYTLRVDSNPTTQSAKVLYPGGTFDSVVSLQEPSWNYINFVRLKNGVNRFVFYISSYNADISVAYSECRELV